MNKSEILIKLSQQKCVVVVRGNCKSEGFNASKACIAGGIKAIEVAYTNNNASQIIAELSSEYQNDDSVIIGAGTVLDPETARFAILSGAKFIVSPSFNAHTATLCNRYAIPYIPGCMTITEVQTALESGCEMIKVFPGGTLGLSFIKSLKTPLPQVQVMVTGGVNLTNAPEWFKAGASAIGIGGEFNQLATQNKFEEITMIAEKYKNIVS